MCGIWHSVNIVFLGALRDTEVERLNEQVWREVMEILFAMTVFKEEFNLYLLFLITMLMFIKSHHWLAQKRLDYIETSPSAATLTHVRLCTFMALLLTLDCLFFRRSFSHLLKTREASVSLFFVFEYFVLVSTTIGMFIKYSLHMGELYMEGPFRSKAVCLFYLELVQDLLHLSLYLLFFLFIFMHYGLPLHLVRELHDTFRNFKNRVTDFLRYRRLTSNMNERFPDASAEDLTRDATCIVCREDMVEAKTLPCGHLFHIHCLRQWLERRNTCPTCRAPVLPVEDDQVTEDQPNEGEVQPEEGDFTPQNIPEGGDVEYYIEPTPANPTNWPELQAAATAAAANYAPSFILPVLAHGYPICYPVLFPYHPLPHSLSQESLNAQNEVGGQHDNVASSQGSGTYAPVVVTATGNQHDIVQRWIWKHTMTQTAQLFMQLQQNAMQSWSTALRSNSPAFGVPNSSFISTIQRREEYTEDHFRHYAVGLTVQNDAQLMYLKRVSEVREQMLPSLL
ncbi:hypothetical protein R1sor_020631 [Riccia sorocarpa]|uniref:RING-type E3 ubiquitin transferase n=1 Tax=Riccia sorocarpa TaxID=122646 RepID=A0ABD3GHV9_9MARC